MPAKKPNEYIKDLVKEANPADLAILSFGFYAGWQGITILDYFLGDLPLTNKISQTRSTMDSAAAELFGLEIGIPFLGAADLFYNSIFHPSDQSSSAATGNTPATVLISGGLISYEHYNKLTQAQKNTLNKLTETKIAMGCMGAIVAYAMTRPGFLPALMQLAGTALGDVGKLFPMAL